MHNNLEKHPQVNHVRIIIIIAFVIVLWMSYNNSNKIKTKLQRNMVALNSKQVDNEIQTSTEKVNTIIKTQKPVTIYDRANNSSVVGSLPRGEDLLIISISDNGVWMEAQHNENVIWIKANQL